MRRRVRTLCVSALLALSACTRLEDVGAGTTVTCTSASECPGGRVCNRGFCVNPDLIDTTPPDLAGWLQPTPARVRAGQSFTVHLQATEPLDPNGTWVSLALVPPVALDCAQTSGVDWQCSYTATGHENGDLGGDIALDVRMRDLSGNDTARSSVGTVAFDFTPPSPTLATVAYYPGATNPLPSVTVATAGTGVRVAVSADELLSATASPSLVGRSGAATLRFALYAGGYGQADAVFATTVAAGQPDGDYALEVGWEDAVGNVGSTAVAGTSVRVKTSRPTLAVNQAAVVFVRSPWGNGAAEDLGGYAVPAGPYFAIEPAEPLSAAAELPAGTFLLDGGVVPERIQVKAGEMTVGTLFPQPGGTWRRQALASPDTYTVQVVGYDAAGNVSDPQPIGTVEWVATSNLPAIGESPHVVRRTPLVEAMRVQRTELGAVTEANIAARDGVGELATAQGVWRKMTFTASGTRTIDASALAYDAVRGRVVMFGGMLSSTPMQEVYEWDGRQWLDLTPVGTAPAARAYAAIAYDGARGRVVVFGGQQRYDSGTGLYTRFADTWEWDGTAWAERTPASSPPERSQAAMAYDSARRRVVLYGGVRADGTRLGDTWEWDGETWTSVTPAGQTPGTRYGHSLVYDPGRDRTVLLGGAADDVVWEWDGAAWTPIVPGGARPPLDQPSAYLHDGAAGHVTILGAVWDGAGTHGGAWRWDGSSWTTITTMYAPTPFPNPTAPSIAFDVARQRTVLVVGGNSVGNGTWEWDGAGWRDVRPNGTRAPARYMGGGALAYDSGRRRMVLFGGSGNFAKDTWEWDGNNWMDVAPEATSPYGWVSNLVYDASRRRTFAVDTLNDITWAWDGAIWTSVVTPAPSSITLAYDATHRQLLALDWTGATWTWTGSGWVSDLQQSPAGGSFSVFDSATGRPLVFDPRVSTQAMFEWTGSGWVDVTAATPQPLRNSPCVAYDSERARLMMFGGTTAGGSVAWQDSWEWNGTIWRDVTPDGTKPQGRRMCSLAYDPDRHRTVLFSGNDIGGDVSWDDTWELEARPVTRPAIQFDASMARTGIAPASVKRVRVRAWAGGAFTVADPGAAGGAGTTLRGWANHSTATGPGGWEPLATSAAGILAGPPWLGAPAGTLVERELRGPDARRFVTERDRQLSFQVVPSGTMGSDPGGARVALDYIEVRVRYAAVP